jgi:protein-L-isoaspartate(D-aspartate) O-methyltransferase
MTDLDAYRRFFAEEVQIVGNIQSPLVVEALRSVPREKFLPPGPWVIRSEADFAGGMRKTPDADPRHVYHNITVGIDPQRMLFNGVPSLISMTIDALSPQAGDRVLHIGTGLGYFTAIAAHCVGASGRVVGIEVDEPLAARARANLEDMRWVDVRAGDGTDVAGETFDAILVNAGVTHPLPQWLDSLSERGRIAFPITAGMPAMGNIGKGLMLLAKRSPGSPNFDIRSLTLVAIYSALGLRDDHLNGEIGKALQKHPFPPIRRLRRDSHAHATNCWLHTETFCLSLE